MLTPAVARTAAKPWGGEAMTGKSQPMPSITRGTTATGATIAGQGWLSRLQSMRGGTLVATMTTSIMSSARASWIATVTASPATGTTASSPPRIEREEGGGSDGGVDDAADNDRNDNAVVEVDDKDPDDIRDNLSSLTKEMRKRWERTSADNDDGGGSGGGGGGGGG